MYRQSPLDEKLAALGAIIAHQDGCDVIAHFGDAAKEYDAACRDAVLFDLSPRAKVEVTGPEAAEFLHNLCTNDVKSLAPGSACETFLTTAKARVVAHLLASRLNAESGSSFLLDSAPGSGQTVLNHLDHFLISERVELTDRTSEFGLLFLCGPQAAEKAGQLLGVSLAELPDLSHKEIELEGAAMRVRRNDFLAMPGYEVFTPIEAAARVWDKLAGVGAAPAGYQTFTALRIEAGFPMFGVDIDEDRLAMEIGRTAQAISYNKGCFLGQETIVMARDRGHVNRLLMGIVVKAKLDIPSGAGVFREDKEVGAVTSSVYSPRMEGTIALAYLRRGNHEPGMAVEIDTATGRKQAVVKELPFVDFSSAE